MINDATNDAVKYTVVDKTATLQLDDGGDNTLTYAKVDALLAALGRAEHDATSIVIAGRADHFSSGFDPAEMAESHDGASRLVARTSELLLRLYSTQLPLVVACTGSAIAAGALIVLTGDVRIGAAGAWKLGLDEVAHGKPVPALAVELARARLAVTELAIATLTSTLYDVEAAQRVGFLDIIAPGPEVITRATETAKRLGALSNDAYAATKQRIRGATIELMRG